MPRRIRLSRAKGWRLPAGAVVVARPSAFGNPFTIADARASGAAADTTAARALVVRMYAEWIRTGRHDDRVAPGRRQAILDRLPELRGRDLACWCPLDQPCHADVLMDVAN